MLLTLPVRQAALLLGVHKDTVFRWRHRLLAGLVATDLQPLGPTVTLHETWFPWSEKGSRSLSRAPRRRAAFHRHHITPAWVAIARDDAGRLAGGVVGAIRPMAADLARVLGDRLTRATTLASTIGPYGAPGILAVRLGLEYRREFPVDPAIVAIRGYTVQLRRWLRRFRGVATRYLDHYLAWHRFLVIVDAMGVTRRDRRRSLLTGSFPCIPGAGVPGPAPRGVAVTGS